jgi:hypothetical protein
MPFNLFGLTIASNDPELVKAVLPTIEYARKHSQLIAFVIPLSQRDWREKKGPECAFYRSAWIQQSIERSLPVTFKMGGLKSISASQDSGGKPRAMRIRGEWIPARETWEIGNYDRALLVLDTSLEVIVTNTQITGEGSEKLTENDRVAMGASTLVRDILHRAGTRAFVAAYEIPMDIQGKGIMVFTIDDPHLTMDGSERSYG